MASCVGGWPRPVGRIARGVAELVRVETGVGGSPDVIQRWPSRGPGNEGFQRLWRGGLPGARPTSNDGHGAFWEGCVGGCELWCPTRESQRYGAISCLKKAARQRYGAISFFAKNLVYPPTPWFARGALKFRFCIFHVFGKVYPQPESGRGPNLARPATLLHKLTL